MTFSYEIKGLDNLINKASGKLLHQPLRDFFKRAAITVQGKARENAPVDTGHLRNSIMYEVDSAEFPAWAKVGILNASEGSPLWVQARAMEFGTGSQGDPAVSHKSSHWPPGDALSVWAGRHGFNSGYAVAAAIGKRGGLKPRLFLRHGLEQSQSAITGFISKLGDEIRAAWDAR